jgi:hypothetical protein
MGAVSGCKKGIVLRKHPIDVFPVANSGKCNRVIFEEKAHTIIADSNSVCAIFGFKLF